MKISLLKVGNMEQLERNLENFLDGINKKIKNYRILDS
jgi:hypothetical protein